MNLKKIGLSKKTNSLLSIINKYMIIFFLATILFIVFTIFYITQPPSEIEEFDDDFSSYDEIINDTISPKGINQAVSIEIKRIHKRHIENEMRKPGFFWRQKPTFYVKVFFNEESWKSIDITDWDTGFAGWQVNCFVEDESETIDISLQIIEKNTISLQKKETVIEEFSVNYNFRTGRWDGADSFKDNDGYGHYVGSDYEIWFGLYQTEKDGDNIPYWTEINTLGTDPMVDDDLLDPDNDGIPTSWEWRWGYDPFVYDNHSNLDPDHDGLENTEEYFFEKWLSNPFHQDIFLEVDYMEKGPGLFAMEHIFFKESQWMVMDVFTDHDITVHIDDGWPTGSSIGGGEYLPYNEEFLSALSGVLSGFYKYHFADCRKGSFRYVVVHHSGGWSFAQTNQLHCDVLSIPSNQGFFNTAFFPPAVSPRLKRIAIAVAVLHELGHSLKLIPSYHEGIDNASQIGDNTLPFLQKIKKRIEARLYWNTYNSVMNYQKFNSYVLDYSDGSHGKRDADDWDQIDLTFFQTPLEKKYGVGDD